MINYEKEVKKIYPNTAIQKVGYYDWHKNRYKDENPQFIVTGYFVNIPTIWMPQAKYPEQAWKIAYEKLNQPKQMTPLQKSIAEIEAMRDEFNPMCDEFTLLDKAVETLTANLEYERDVIQDTYSDGYNDCLKLLH